jgi:hypothetical protein
LDFQDCLLGFHNPEIDHRINFDRYVVLGDDILRGDIHDYDTQAYPDHAIDRGEHKNQTWSFGLGQYTSKTEDYASLIFSQDFYRVQEIEYDEGNDDYRKSYHFCLLIEELRIFLVPRLLCFDL